MSIALLFWVLMLFVLLFGAYRNRAALRGWATTDLIFWLLIALLGWQVFGPAVHK